jgi:predicted RecB family nuclease
MTICSDLFNTFLKCPTKCWLRAAGEQASGNAYAEWAKAQNASYHAAHIERLLSETPKGEVAVSPSLENLNAVKWRLAVNLIPHARMNACVLKSKVHAVEPSPSEGRGRPTQLILVRFIFSNRLSDDDKLLLAFDTFVLSEATGCEISFGTIIHGDDHSALKVKTTALSAEVRSRIERIAILLSSPTPPDLVLNRHCGECEFQTRCQQKAVETDDLSLLPGMSEKERKKLRSKGIFTVTQLSYTFRPRRRPKRMRDKQEKYHHSLKALAIREKKIHIVGRPELKIDGIPIYLDVEGLPDRDFYYLIGVRIDNGDSAVHHSLWADTPADEGKIWRDFLAMLETVEKPVLIHYGSYETAFLKRMGERHGKPHEGSVAAKAIKAAVNLLSVIFAKVYFPTFSNGLKEIAGHLGFH